MIIEDTPLDDNSPCPINGRCKGMPMGDVPSRFLDWFLGQPHLVRKYKKVVEYCQSRKKAIDQDLEDEDEGSGFNQWEDSD